MPNSAEQSELYYDRHLFCCTAKRDAGHPRGCCWDRGADELQGYMKTRARELGLEGIRVNQSGCLDRCELGPVVVIYPEGIWYTYQNQADVDEILERHVRDGGRVERLMLTADQVPPGA